MFTKAMFKRLSFLYNLEENIALVGKLTFGLKLNNKIFC